MTVVDPGEGPRGLPSPFLDQIEAQRAKKIVLRPPPIPLSQGLDDCPAPLSEGLDPPLHEQQPQDQSTNIYYLKLKCKVTMKELINLFILLDSQKITSIQ